MARRDRDLFVEFASNRAAALQRTAYLLVGEEQLAQDLVQEALVRTWTAWGRLHDPANAEAYCRRVLTTTAIGWFRRRGWGNERPTEVLPERSEPARDEAVDERLRVWQAIRQLPPRQRAALVLRYYDDLTEVQTADALDCAVGTVKSQVSAALRRLRDLLGDEADLVDSDTMVVNR